MRSGVPQSMACLGAPPSPLRPKSSWHRFSLSSTAQIPSVTQAVTSAMAAENYPEKDLWATCLGLEEALVNALKHGNQLDPTKRVRVRFCVDSERTLVQVRDEGAGFDPDEVSDPLAPENLDRPTGRGLLLMRSFLSWIRFNRRGNLVLLCKERSAGR